MKKHGFEVRFASYWNTILFPLMVAQRKLVRSSGASDVRPFHPLVNNAFKTCLAMERAFIRRGVAFRWLGAHRSPATCQVKTLSIIIPVYNGASSIERLVHQLAQLKVDGGVELVLVNDCSPDNSWNHPATDEGATDAVGGGGPGPQLRRAQRGDGRLRGEQRPLDHQHR